MASKYVPPHKRGGDSESKTSSYDTGSNMNNGMRCVYFFWLSHSVFDIPVTIVLCSKNTNNNKN